MVLVWAWVTNSGNLPTLLKEDKLEENKDIRFIAFLDEDNNKIEGYFEVLVDNGILIRFKTASNVITIPYSRLLKMKERKEES